MESEYYRVMLGNDNNLFLRNFLYGEFNSSVFVNLDLDSNMLFICF